MSHCNQFKVTNITAELTLSLIGILLAVNGNRFGREHEHEHPAVCTPSKFSDMLYISVVQC